MILKVSHIKNCVKKEFASGLIENGKLYSYTINF